VIFDLNSGVTATGLHVNATGSYERAILDLQVNQGNPAYDGVVFQNGAFIQDGEISVHGNFGTSTTALTSAAIRVAGTAPAGILQPTNSNITNSLLVIGCEVDQISGTNAPYTVFFNNSYNFIGACTGNVDFGAADPFQSSNSGGQWTGFTGTSAGDANLPASLPAGSTNIADSAQVITAVVGAPAAVANVSAVVAAFTAYRVRIYVPYSSSAVAGTPTFLFTGPGFALASLTWRYQTAATPFTTAPVVAAAAPVMTGPVLSAGANLALIADGTIAFSSAGTAGLSAYTSNSADPFTIAIGAYFEVLPMSAP
jgi:hypothetical protein